MFTYMESSLMNKTFHPGFRSAHCKYQHLVGITLGSLCHYYGKLETRNHGGDDWPNVGTNVGTSGSKSFFLKSLAICGYVDHYVEKTTSSLILALTSTRMHSGYKPCCTLNEGHNSSGKTSPLYLTNCKIDTH